MQKIRKIQWKLSEIARFGPVFNMLLLIYSSDGKGPYPPSQTCGQNVLPPSTGLALRGICGPGVERLATASLRTFARSSARYAYIEILAKNL